MGHCGHYGLPLLATATMLGVGLRSLLMKIQARSNTRHAVIAFIIALLLLVIATVAARVL